MKTKPKLSVPALGGCLFMLVCALLPSPAQAQCQHWDVSGQWELRQDNGVDVQVNLQQQGANLTGTATVKEKELALPVACVVSGNITDNAFTLEVRMAGNKTPVSNSALRYIGTVRPSGVIYGTSWLDSVRGPGVKVKWFGGKAKCADANAPVSKQKAGDASPSPSSEADKSSSSDTEGQPKKHKKKHKHHHDDDDQEQSSD